MTSQADLEYCQSELSRYCEVYLDQLQHLEQDADWILRQLQADTHRLLAHLHQKRATVYAEKPVTEESWKRLIQLDQWIETLLQQFQENQTRCLVQVQQQRTSLYSALKANCNGVLLSTFIGSLTENQPPAT